METEAAVVLTGALIGGFVSGLAGFGTGLAALGIWLHVLPPATASALVIICSVVSQTQTLPTIWHAISIRRVWPIVVPGMIGVPLGTALLGIVDPAWFKLAVGLLLLGFSGFLLATGGRLRIHAGGRLADAAVGLAGGLLGGLAGLSGPLPTLWASLRGWGKDERRAVFQAFNWSVLTLSLLVHWQAGLLTRQIAWLALAALPGTIGGAWLGARLYRRLSDRRFADIVLGLLFLSGIGLSWSSLHR